MNENVDVQGKVNKEIAGTVAAGVGVVGSAAEKVLDRLEPTRQALWRDVGERIRKALGFRNRMR